MGQILGWPPHHKTSHSQKRHKNPKQKSRNYHIYGTHYSLHKTDQVFAANVNSAKPIQPVQHISAPLYYI